MIYQEMLIQLIADQSDITGNIIAMGYPSEGAEAMYRNKMSTVQR